MPVRTRPVDRGRERGRYLTIELARQAEDARVDRGLSYAALGRALGLSGAHVARMCRGEVRSVAVSRIAQLFAVLGLELAARGYPVGPAVRDAAHVALLDRIRSRLTPALRWRAEVPVVGGPSLPALRADLRSWDAAIEGPGWTLHVEAETHVRDVQALLRRVALKQRDGAAERVILVLADTRHHRGLLRAAETGDLLRTAFPGSPRQTLAALASGSCPPASAVLLL